MKTPAEILSAAGDLDLEAQRALAAEMFPQAWAATLRETTGERRRRRQASLRGRAVYAQKLAPLKAAGASCATCQYWSKHFDLGQVCDVQSDFRGYVRTKADHLCADWKGRASDLARAEEANNPREQSEGRG